MVYLTKAAFIYAIQGKYFEDILNTFQILRRFLI